MTDAEILAAVEKVMEEEVSPALASHGGGATIAGWMPRLHGRAHDHEKRD